MFVDILYVHLPNGEFQLGGGCLVPLSVFDRRRKKGHSTGIHHFQLMNSAVIAAKLRPDADTHARQDEGLTQPFKETCDESVTTLIFTHLYGMDEDWGPSMYNWGINENGTSFRGAVAPKTIIPCRQRQK